MKEIVFLNFRDLNYPGGTPIRINGLIRNMPKDIKIHLLSAFDVPKDIREKVNFIEIPNIHRVNKFIFYIFSFYTAFRFLRPLFKKIIFFNKNIQKLNLILKKHKNKQIMFYQNGGESLSFFSDLGYTTIFDIHGIVENYTISNNKNIKEKIKIRVEKNRFEDADKVISISKEMERYIFDKYAHIEKSKFYISYDGFDISYLKKENLVFSKEIKEKYNILKEDDTLLFAGGLKYSGGIFELLEAVKIYKNDYNKNIKLLLIIDKKSKLYTKFYTKIKEYKLVDSIIIIGIVKKEELLNYQRVSKVLICPDIDSPYNHICPHIKYFDCLASKVPTINGKFNCLENLGFDDTNSFLYSPVGNPKEMAKKLNEIFINYKEAKEKAIIGFDKMINYHTYKNSSLIFRKILDD